MSGWANFFIAEVGASAALAGLNFVGVSINLSRILAFPTLPGRALEALLLLIDVLVVASLAFVPSQPLWLVGAEMLVIGAAIWLAILVIQARALRLVPKQYRRAQVMKMFLSQLTTLPFVAAGGTLLVGINWGLFITAAGVILCFLVALLDAWVPPLAINR